MANDTGDATHRIGVPAKHPPATPPPATTHASGPPVQIDLDHANTALAHLKTVVEQLENALSSIGGVSMLGQLRPGTDDHSGRYEQDAVSAFQRAETTVQHHLADAQAQYDNLKATIDQYKHTDAGNAGNMTRKA